MREHLRQTESTVIELDKRVTDKPTSYAMTGKFRSLQIVECNGIRQFASPLTPFQKQYLGTLHLKEDSLLMYESEENDTCYD